MTPALEVSDLSFQYPDGRLALHHLDFEVAPGERLALLGANGSGKSTLLLHLDGLLPQVLPLRGSIRIAGRELNRDTVWQLRREVGLLFQDPDDQILAPTVAEDVAFGPTQLGLENKALQERVEEALSAVGLKELAQEHPHRLSHGEKRRVCLAGVLACRPSLLLLDEPSAGLDPRSRRELIGLLRGIPATQIIATHDLDLALALCDRVLLIERGEKRAEGPTHEILHDEALLQAHGLELPPSLSGLA